MRCFLSSVNPQQIIDTQRQDWNRVASAWEKWDQLLDRNLAFVNYRLIGDARLREGDHVLDLGSGTGYPALLAAHAVGANGRVVGLDLADSMLEVARRKATSLRISTTAFKTSDITRLSFESGSFDAVISRFCLMFLPDVPKAVGEITRVLKLGGYLAAAVWSAPEKNPYLRIPTDVVKQFIDLPAPEPDTPGIFRLAKPRELSDMAHRAGLQPLADEEVSGDAVFSSSDEYWTHLIEIAAPLQGMIAKLSTSQRMEAESRIKHAVNQFLQNGAVHLPMAIRIIVARKPL